MRGFCGIGLHMPKNDMNVGGAMRAAQCYGAGLVVVQGQRYWPMSTDTMKAWRSIPVIHGAIDLFESIPYACRPVAVELVDQAECLTAFKHPQNAFYIFGPEDGSLGNATLSRCTSVVKIPTKFCMNLASTVNVVLYDRLAKQLAKAKEKEIAE